MAECHDRYALVSPVKDEARFIAQTLESVIHQNVLPARWVIVDDGSRDRTAAIVREYVPAIPWITLVRTAGGARQPGSAVIRAFNYGVQFLNQDCYDFLVKLDCDLSFAPDYFEKLLTRFHAEERLGILSGVYREARNGRVAVVAMPAYHAAGASKMVRTACFREIGGFIAERGWDTVDEIRAQVRKWNTGHLEDAVMDHLKPEGAGIGQMRTNVMHGEIAYTTGGGVCLFVAKTITRVLHGKPPFLAALALQYGYLRAALLRRPLLVTEPEARYYRSLLNQRLAARLRQPRQWLLNLRSRLSWRFS